MPIVSKYPTEKVESLTNQLHSILLEEDAKLDLSMMVVGNLLSHIINSNVSDSQKQAIADEFSKALKQSIK